MELKDLSDLGNVISAASLLATVWLALVAVHRSESRSVVDKAENVLEELQREIMAFWSSNEAISSQELQFRIHKLAQLCNRVELWTKKSSSRVHPKNPTAIRAALAQLSDLATLDAEALSEISLADKQARYIDSFNTCTAILLGLEMGLDRKRHLVLWW